MRRKGHIILSQESKNLIARKIRVYKFVSQYFFKKAVFFVKQKFPSISSWYAGHFPAVRINSQPTALEYGLNFSSEAVVGMVVLVIALANVVVFNPFKAAYNHNDNSLAAYFLRNHEELNTELYDKQNPVNTTIANNKGLFAQVFADYSPSLTEPEMSVSTLEEELISDNGITKANPDSIQRLVSDQVKIYETKPFDTVYTVAKEFGLTPKTIRETNSLPNNALKAGWFLVIPPVDGIVIEVTNPNLTLTDAARAYNADITKVVSYNGLEDEEDMVEVGEYLIIPHGQLPPEQPKPASPEPSKPTQKVFKPSVPKAATIAGNHKFAPGYCTDYVARKVPGIKWGGNANRWIANSKAFGATVDRNPKAGAILVTSENARYGHVAYIESVSGSKVTISEWNYEGLYIKTVRTLDISDSRIKGVIHP